MEYFKIKKLKKVKLTLKFRFAFANYKFPK